jgi:hypothetical protein
MKTLKQLYLVTAAALVSLLEPLHRMVVNHLARTGLMATMILDQKLLFDGTVSSTTGAVSGSAIGTAAGSSQVSTNVIDLQNARDLGVGHDGGPTPMLLVLVTTAFQSTGAGTLTIAFQGSDTNTAGATWTTHAQSRAIALADLALNNMLFNVALPAIVPQGGTLPRYLRLSYSVGTAIFSVGSLVSAIVLSRQHNRAYPAGITVQN